MKFCLNSRVSSQYLKTADQIKVAYRDFASIPGVIEKYPDTEIIVSLPNPPTDKELEELRNYNKKKLNFAKILKIFQHFWL